MYLSFKAVSCDSSDPRKIRDHRSLQRFPRMDSGVWGLCSWTVFQRWKRPGCAQSTAWCYTERTNAGTIETGQGPVAAPSLPPWPFPGTLTPEAPSELSSVPCGTPRGPRSPQNPGVPPALLCAGRDSGAQIVDERRLCAWPTLGGAREPGLPSPGESRGPGVRGSCGPPLRAGQQSLEPRVALFPHRFRRTGGADYGQ